LELLNRAPLRIEIRDHDGWRSYDFNIIGGAEVTVYD
jgi:hypothetical protein